MRSRVADAGPTQLDSQAVYEIQVEGELDHSWEQWFSGLTTAPESDSGQPLTAAGSSERLGDLASPNRTTLTGAVADQAALRGMLCRLWDLNLTVVSVRRIETEDQGG